MKRFLLLLALMFGCSTGWCQEGPLSLVVNQQPLPQTLESSRRSVVESTSEVSSNTAEGSDRKSHNDKLDAKTIGPDGKSGLDPLAGELSSASHPVESAPAPLIPSWESWTSPERLTGNLRLVAVMASLSLAPAILLMTTCYVRLVVVLGLLRQALGSQQLPPQQVMATLALFLTALIMWPTWNEVHQEAIKPYSDPKVEMTAEEAWARGVKPVREFMSHQIRRADNGKDVEMFMAYLDLPPAKYYADVPLQALLPAFLISELKIAFLIGFQIYLPFLLLDLVVSSVTMSMGMVMVPPNTISLPLKLVLFVLVDGWHLVVEMLLMSFSGG